jgi:Acetoacetate decarboxylase (ADC)
MPGPRRGGREADEIGRTSEGVFPSELTLPNCWDTVWNGKTKKGGKLESGIGVPAVFSKTTGNYAVFLYLNKALPIVGGREIWGWPKKDAEITFNEGNREISGRVERSGSVLLSLTAKLEKKSDPVGVGDFAMDYGEILHDYLEKK